MGGTPHIDERDWYTAREVAEHFGVDPETVRIAGRDARIPAVNAGTSRYAQWRYPKVLIDGLQLWPSPIPRLVESDATRLVEEELARLRLEVDRLRQELQEEKIGRALAEKELTTLTLAGERQKRALAALLLDEDHPEFRAEGAVRRDL